MNKIESNECGGFKPPKGHLDTQMFPECEGTPTDRNIVKKTVEKRKTKKKEASIMNKTAKHGYPIVSDKTRKGIWEQWLDNEITNRDFIELMKDVVMNSFIGVSQDISVRNKIKRALETVKKTWDYKAAAEEISRALTWGKTTEESLLTQASKLLAKHTWPIVTNDAGGFLQKWEKGEMGDKEFVEKIKYVANNNFSGVTSNNIIRESIVSSLKAFDVTGDETDAARSIAQALKANYTLDENDNDILTAKKNNKKEWDPNPWAVCTESVGRENKEKFEKCVKKVKEKQSFNLKEYRISKKKSPKEHGFIEQCIKENKDKDDPGAYCASIVDKVKGTTKWREDK